MREAGPKMRTAMRPGKTVRRAADFNHPNRDEKPNQRFFSKRKTKEKKKNGLQLD